MRLKTSLDPSPDAQILPNSKIHTNHTLRLLLITYYISSHNRRLIIIHAQAKCITSHIGRCAKGSSFPRMTHANQTRLQHHQTFHLHICTRLQTLANFRSPMVTAIAYFSGCRSVPQTQYDSIRLKRPQQSKEVSASSFRNIGQAPAKCTTNHRWAPIGTARLASYHSCITRKSRRVAEDPTATCLSS